VAFSRDRRGHGDAVMSRSDKKSKDPSINAARYLGLKVEHHSFPKLRLVLRLLGSIRGSPDRLMVSEKLALILAIGAAGKFAGMVIPELTKRGANVRGFVRNSMPKDFVGSQVKACAIQRNETAEELVGAVFFLASPDAGFISGQTVNLDGGKHLL
jgi:hypothetical protein